MFGLAIRDCNYIVKINKNGMFLINNGGDTKFHFKSHDGQPKVVHSLESFDYLKLEPSNYIYFQNKPEYDEVNILQEYSKEDYDKSGFGESKFATLYQVKLQNISLRELLTFQSLYISQTMRELIEIV